MKKDTIVSVITICGMAIAIIIMAGELRVTREKLAITDSILKTVTIDRLIGELNK